MATATQVVPSTSSAPSPSPTRPPSDCQILRACFPTVHSHVLPFLFQTRKHTTDWGAAMSPPSPVQATIFEGVEDTAGLQSTKGFRSCTTWAVIAFEDLDLSYNILNGSLPDGLLLLPNLTQLTLTNNEFSGRLPDIIANSSLQFMQLSNNNFSGPLPSSIGMQRISLTLAKSHLHLDASNNSFSGNLPNAMGELTLLETILFNNNAINGSLPSTLGRLANLTVLLMSGNRLQTGLNNMVGLNNLAYLDLSRNQLIERFPDLQLFPKLSLVDISGNCIAFEQVKGNPDFKVEPQFYNCSGLADRIDPTASVNGSGVFGDLGASEKTSMPPALIAGIAIVALIATALFILAAVVATRASNKKLARAALQQRLMESILWNENPLFSYVVSMERFGVWMRIVYQKFQEGLRLAQTFTSHHPTDTVLPQAFITPTVTTGVEVGVISAYDIVEEDRRSPSPVLSMRKFDFKQLPPTEVGVDMLLNRDPVVTPIITDATEGMEFRAPIGSTDFIDLFSSGFLTSTGPTVEPPLVNLDHDIKEKPHDWDPNAPLPPQRERASAGSGIPGTVGASDSFVKTFIAFPKKTALDKHIVNTSASSSNPRTESSLAVNNNHTESDAEARIVVTPPMPESVVRTVRMSGTEMVLPPAAEGGVVMPRLFAQDTLSVGLRSRRNIGGRALSAEQALKGIVIKRDVVPIFVVKWV
ncbi:hypothetical protein BC829DRAFT_420816 [Chytridium lagenaria]|nr:hypothetical protein BC829DRAFT_420816 [Chytridium lagenaria]